VKVIIDNKIPFIRETAERLFDEVLYLPGCGISADDVKETDALIVRTRTKCDKTLLEGSKVQFVATATIGYDHLDTRWLDMNHIHWTNCPGCNATSVAQYVRNSLIVLHQKGIIHLPAASVGVVGVGHVGTAVCETLREFGCRLWPCDPPRAEMEHLETFHSLKELAENCDVITFHTPLTYTGKHASYHLADKDFFQHLSKKPVIVNAARGGVVQENSLLQALKEGKVRAAIIDTWEKEPNISAELLEQAVVATPHIAGYSADGKANATRMALAAVCDFFDIHAEIDIQPPRLEKSIQPVNDVLSRHLQLYNPLNDTMRLKANRFEFERLRENYPLRREMWEQ